MKSGKSLAADFELAFAAAVGGRQTGSVGYSPGSPASRHAPPLSEDQEWRWPGPSSHGGRGPPRLEPSSPTAIAQTLTRGLCPTDYSSHGPGRGAGHSACSGGGRLSPVAAGMPRAMSVPVMFGMASPEGSRSRGRGQAAREACAPEPREQFASMLFEGLTLAGTSLASSKHSSRRGSRLLQGRPSSNHFVPPAASPPSRPPPTHCPRLGAAARSQPSSGHVPQSLAAAREWPSSSQLSRSPAVVRGLAGLARTPSGCLYEARGTHGPPGSPSACSEASSPDPTQPALWHRVTATHVRDVVMGETHIVLTQVDVTEKVGGCAVRGP